MRMLDDAKPASERSGSTEAGKLSVFRMPNLGSDADRLSGMQRSVARRKLGSTMPGSVGSRESSIRRTA